MQGQDDLEAVLALSRKTHEDEMKGNYMRPQAPLGDEDPAL
jgi:hypothetical protein